MSVVASAVELVRWFDQVGIDDVASVGGKNASLGEMYRELRQHGVRIPNGFATTAAAYRSFLEESGLDEKIAHILADVDANDIANLRQRGREVRRLILDTEFPTEFKDAICEAYGNLSLGRGEPMDVAVRSSATAEDLPDASFAGQQETYLNVQGETALLDACRRCFASLFTDRAISYRVDKEFDHNKIALSVGVQEMVRSDIGTSGVMFSLDTESGFRDAVLINAAYGLGENVVQGAVNPDEYYVFKPTLRNDCRPILKKSLGTKEVKMVYDIGGGKLTKNVPVPPEERTRFAVSDDDILTLARWACQIEDHYSAKKGYHCPMDMEWAKDGNTEELFIVQARPETVQSRKSRDTLETFRLTATGTPIVTGGAVGSRIGQGRVRVIPDASRLAEFQDGEVLVTEKTDPDWEPIMKKAAGIVTNRGGRTCHAAIVSRELGLPAIVGTRRGTELLHDGQEVTLSCAEGDTGVVYEGLLPFEVDETKLENLQRPKTNVMMMGLTNVKLMIPFCRTVEEGRRVQEVMAQHGLVRGENGLEIYVMCEIPSNVIRAEAFAEIFDGFSIGSNDLTQLTLGVDRDSEIVAHVFNERDPAVMSTIQSAIEAAKRTGRKIGICGQAPSDYPEFAQFLVEQGIDSISLNPDAVLKTTVTIQEME